MLFLDKLIDRLLSSFDFWERRELSRLRSEGKLFLLSELSPFFKAANIFVFGTGGSIANLSGVERLVNYNLMMTTTGPLYMYRIYGFIPNLWTFTYPPIIELMLKAERSTRLDFSETFILVPTNDSDSKIHFSTPAVREFRKRHPEATFVLYRQSRRSFTKQSVPSTYLMEGMEPLYGMEGSVLDNLFLPVCFYWGISEVYFCGVDLIPTTGHFWDRNKLYQTMDGKPLDFPKKAFVLACADVVRSICKRHNRNVYRLEPKETVLQTYPYMDFERSLALASAKITPEAVRKEKENIINYEYRSASKA